MDGFEGGKGYRYSKVDGRRDAKGAGVSIEKRERVRGVGVVGLLSTFFRFLLEIVVVVIDLVVVLKLPT